MARTSAATHAGKPRPARPAKPAGTTVPPIPAGFRGRALERTLLLANLPLVLFAAWGVAAAQQHPTEAFIPAAIGVGIPWLGCLALHLLLCLTRFDGDLLLLPLLSLILTVGATFHLDMRGPASAGITPGPYTTAVFLGLSVLALVTAGGRWFKRLSILLEERVWWRIAGDRPYYDSIPFHFLLVGLMVLLSLLLMVKGIRSTGDALIQVTLPGGLTFTPSELIRLAVAFFLADYLGRNSRVLRTLREPIGRVWPLNRIRIEPRVELTVLLTTVMLYCFFFYAFRDFGPAAVIIVLTLASLYASTGRLLTPLTLGAAFALVIAIPTWKNLAFHTLRNRIGMWLDPWNTHFVNGDHQARILWSISSGGWYGMGVGTQNLPQTLPLARNDAAFAGIAASMGMWTALALLGVFAALTWRGMVAARQAGTDRMRLLGFCLTTLLAFQAIWICGAMVRVFPFTGINLPFISTGLTSMVASALALGTIWNISRSQSARPDATEATPEVLRGVTRLAMPITASFALPAIGLILYACPWLLGDRVLMATAFGINRQRDRTAFVNPYLERFKRRFPRGRIFSADGQLVAVSNPSPEEVRALAERSPAFAKRVESRERSGAEGERYYPLGSSAAQLIGWAAQGKFQAQQGSVETAWDGLLRGYQPRDLPFFFRTRHNPVVRPPAQQDLQLTVPADLQAFTARRLSEAVREWDGAGGAAVVYDANTGEVLAAATAPTFDPNDLTLERMQKYVATNPRTSVLTNKALARDALYFPGSSFKILTAAAGLEEGVTGSVTCRNGRNAEAIAWEHGGKSWRRDPGKISDYSDSGHGPLSLTESMDRAMAASCNVFFGKLAAELGPDRLHRAMQQAELSRVPSPEALAEHLPYSGFGQIDVKCSPLEMAMLAAAAGVARDEQPDTPAARPHWVQAVVRQNKKRQPEGIVGAPDRDAYRPFPPEVARRVREMMVQVVESPSGTAHAAFYRGGAPRLPGITVGGKTGTAEFEKQGKSGGRSRTTIGRHAWFVGFARSDHEVEPRTLAFAVLVEDVRRGGTGGRVCAPVARELIAKILPQPGSEPQTIPSMLDRFYQQRIRPSIGPLGPIVDWLRGIGRR